MTRLSLSLFGGFEARFDEAPLTGFTTDKVRALLAYLVVEMGHPHRRQVLAGLLWPGYLESSARASLRHALANLRQVLAEPQNPTSFLLIQGETIQFNPACDHWLDVEDFRSLIEADLPGQPAMQRLEQALDLYKGGFLEGFSLKDSAEFDTWSSIVREELQRQALTALYRLAEAYEGQGDLDSACSCARRQLELEPWREEAHHQLMRLLVMSGRRASALAQYTVCRKILADGLGVEPAEATKALYEQIRAGDVETVVARKENVIVETQIPSQAEKPRQNLPVQPTSFIGREKEIAAINRLLAEHRLVTLTGSGGVGKSRLSIQAGLEVLERFADGVWFIDLAPLANPDLFLQTVATALGVRAGADDLMEALILALRFREVLLVLDNCEHLLEACGGLSDKLLRSCPQVKILASSRTPLRVGGEALYRVPSLAYPESHQVLTVENLLEYAAVCLLVERTRLSLPEYQVTVQNKGALVRICQRLDGIPLALELAAARLNVLTAEQVAHRLEDAFRLLVVGARTALPRHQTLRATIEWSYHLLQKKERLLLHRLAVFSGSFDLQAVEAVCVGNVLEAGELLDRLSTLVDQSIVNALRKQGEETRYSLLETVRQYAREKLSAEEFISLSSRHCDYYMWLAEQAEPRLRSAERLTWTKKMHLERINMQQALEWAFGEGDPHDGIRIIIALANMFWQPSERTAQTVYWVKEGIRRAKNDLDLPRLMLIRLLNCGLLFHSASESMLDFELTVKEAIALCQQIGSQADAELCFTLSISLDNYDKNDKTGMHNLIERCLAVAERLDPVDVWYKAFAYYTIGFVYLQYLGEYDPACQYALEGWRLFQQAGDRWYVTHLLVLGRAAIEEGDYAKARRCYQEAFTVFHEVDDSIGVIESLAYLADLELSQDGPCQGRDAARLMGAAEAVLGYWSENKWKNEKADFFYPQTMNNIRRRLDPDELEAAWAEGAAMSVEEVYKYVLAETGTSSNIP